MIDLRQRLIEHYLDRGSKKSFTGKYNCYILIFHETFEYIDQAIKREKEIKKWSRKKKDQLINSFNPEWANLNLKLSDSWPPPYMYHRRDLK